MIQFYMHYIHPSSKERAKAWHLPCCPAQRTSDAPLKAKILQSPVKTLELDSKASTQAAADFARRSTDRCGS